MRLSKKKLNKLVNNTDLQTKKNHKIDNEFQLCANEENNGTAVKIIYSLIIKIHTQSPKRIKKNEEKIKKPLKHRP